MCDMNLVLCKLDNLAKSHMTLEEMRIRLNSIKLLVFDSFHMNWPNIM